MKAKIQVTRKVEYCKLVEMTQENFDRISNGLESDDRKVRRAAEREVDGFIDPMADWSDDDLHSVDEFEADKP
jgi:hypothetical protein